MSESKLQITYVKSGIGASERQKETLRSLGLKRLGDMVEVKDTPAVRGMLHKIMHLIQVREMA
jgi:large subunit ribosomal protein L30